MISTLKRLAIFAAVCLVPTLAFPQTRASANSDWRARLKEELPLLGHRNWIAVVDSAYPLQTSPGIETVDTGSDHLEVVRRVLHEIAESKHVRPVIFTDA